MGKILVVAEYYHGEYRRSTLHALTAASVLKEKAQVGYDLLLLGPDPKAHLSQFQGCGADQILIGESAELKEYLAEPWAQAIAKVAKEGDYAFILMTATTTGKDLLPRVSALLEAGMGSDIIEILSGETFRRPVYAGNAIATIRITSPRKVLSVRSTAFSAYSLQGELPPVQTLSLPSPLYDKKVEFLSFSPSTKGERPELTEAKIVVSGGRGTKGDFKPVFELADVLGSAVGASRAVVDAGWAPNDWQVGQTGKVVAPQLYIALGISGAIQHWAGMKDSKVIVAINKDPEAPIMQLADYALTADLFQAAPELARKLKELKDRGELQL
jgi:electron transfer flavoprotein alpha subunit